MLSDLLIEVEDHRYQQTTTIKFLLKELKETVISSMQQDLMVLMQLRTMEDQLQYKMVLISKVTRVVQNGIQT